MIPTAFIHEWKNKKAPWIFDAQVEQDLILERLLVELYQDTYIQERLVFRGGTALNKIFCDKAYRYSEDLDFTQYNAEPMGPLMTRVRKIMAPILGKPKWKQTEARVTFYYDFIAEMHPQTKMRIKIEINTREHGSLLGLQSIPFGVESKWFSGEAHILTLHLEEMLATKMRALYQRSKGRDLFDLLYFYQHNPELNWENIIYLFEQIMKAEGALITRAVFEKNIYEKIIKPTYLADMDVLIAPWAIKYKEKEAMNFFEYISPLVSGEAWIRLGVV